MELDAERSGDPTPAAEADGGVIGEQDHGGTDGSVAPVSTEEQSPQTGEVESLETGGAVDTEASADGTDVPVAARQESPREAVERLRLDAEKSQAQVTKLRADIAELSEEIRQVREQPAALSQELDDLRAALVQSQEQIKVRLEQVTPVSAPEDAEKPQPESSGDTGGDRRTRLLHRRRR